MAILAISGRIDSGKDLVGKIIQYLTLRHKQLPNGYNPERDLVSFDDFDVNTTYSLSDWQVKKFADTLKDIVCLLIGCTREQLEDQEFKNLTMEDLYKKGLISKDFYENLSD